MTIQAGRLALGILIMIVVSIAPMAADALDTSRDDKGVWYITGSADETVKTSPRPWAKR